jgi:hypothetical protein
MRVKGRSSSSSSTGTKTGGGRISVDLPSSSAGGTDGSSLHLLLVSQGGNGNGGKARRSSDCRALVDRFVLVRVLALRALGDRKMVLMRYGRQFRLVDDVRSVSPPLFSL